jgi:hypothetical protein
MPRRSSTSARCSEICRSTARQIRSSARPYSSRYSSNCASAARDCVASLLSEIVLPRRLSALVLRASPNGLLIAAVIFVVSGGHVLFLPLLFLLPLGGLFGHRRRYRR